ncbi:Cas10/Cmr2 second palm domain-containing protein [Paenibacillus xylanexedens]|uniref:Cas10/Cmr2 second palm domain-containing protein n=1 Tax=Paenibacillus xylanexedens TaxID=528191 RepID=UPI003D08B708
METYVYIDVSRKQEYIYRNKSLRDNLINSYVIKAITEIPEYAEDGSQVGGSRVMLKTFLEKHFQGEYTVIYSGGGNSMLQFNRAEHAKQFSRKYSLEVLHHYPEIELYISKMTDQELPEEQISEENPLVITKRNMKVIRQMLNQRADLLKDKRRAMFRRWSYGVEKIGENGKPMEWPNKHNNEPEIASGAIAEENDQTLGKARRFLFGRLEERLREMDAKNNPVQITTKLASYKTQNDRKSYIGIIALDGNKMGEMFHRLNSIAEMKEFSSEIERIYADAVAGALYHYAVRHNKTLQVTPVLMSGDDICLVTHAEDALDITADILKQLQALSLVEKDALRNVLNNESAEQSGQQRYLTACAGVAIVKVTYPFFDAIKMAEKLCHQAKEALHRSTENEAASASFIDWDIVQGQVSAHTAYEKHVARARKHEHYRIRPLRVDQDTGIDHGVYSYYAFRNVVSELHSMINKRNLNEQDVSSSFLEKIKKQIYSGWESYSLLFELDQTGSGDKLSQLVKKHFVQNHQSIDMDSDIGRIKSKYGAVIERNARDNRDEYRYVLNDVLETMAFIYGKEAVVHGKQ